MSKMATNIFLKGYQWPFDPQRIENYQSSLIDMLVFNETQKGRRVFMDFQKKSGWQFEYEALLLSKTLKQKPLPICKKPARCRKRR